MEFGHYGMNIDGCAFSAIKKKRLLIIFLWSWQTISIQCLIILVWSWHIDNICMSWNTMFGRILNIIVLHLLIWISGLRIGWNMFRHIKFGIINFLEIYWKKLLESYGSYGSIEIMSSFVVTHVALFMLLDWLRNFS